MKDLEFFEKAKAHWVAEKVAQKNYLVCDLFSLAIPYLRFSANVCK
jgi:hypothetical protein